MAHFEGVAHTDWSPEEVCAYLADFSSVADWDPGVKQARRLDPGPIQEGTRFALTLDLLGQRLDVEYRLTQVAPPSRLVLEAETDTFRSVDTITIERDGRETLVRYRAALEFKGLAALFDLPAHLAFQWIGSQALQGLQAALAAEPPSRRGRSAA